MTRYDWDFSVLFTRPELWLTGLGITFAYAIATIVIGLMIGTVCGIALLSRSWLVRAPIDIYIQVFRCTPVLVQLVFWYNLASLFPMLSLGVPFGGPNPAQNAPGAGTRQALLADGYALIGSSYAVTGWALEEAGLP